ncbi:YidB family protein [Ralstonia pseudosolanacearum]|uniref:YidB family protein n=1 Tax=Ralstonia pseudosolanacearum TaxID=1310165 RepID=UPI0026749D07|nr:YidB family protein [Ralstonia pseudosolanacearum]MDO3505863.1 YidB family protein [Ralstonia pseudosolanacearum]MDO3511062.1 YidB family protein [Ralstonia pseudosolanacearum]MDO3535556.1 YidB family protein [Ralstonia pseudosolanacearum]MDO3604539.1 YidB family protein [Ralstonia pseudosolanacearum]MDO3609449.1 YidB family protein [Ralstonia pseudosolanacearum]
MGLLESVLGLGGNDASGTQSSLLGNKKVLLAAGLLAYLAMKHGNAGAAGAQQDQQGGGLFGSLGSLAGMLGGAGALGGLGGLLGQLTGGGGNTDHAAVDAAAPGGVGPLQQILEQAGLGEQVRSWIGNGQNLPVSGEQITQALGGSGALSQLASTFGLNENEVASQLAEILPDAVNHLTPQGTLPNT